jgi:hypothetical protein
MPDATAALAESPDSPLAQATPPVTAPAAAPQVSNPESAVPDFLEPPPVILPPLPPLPLPHDYVRSGDFVIPIARGTAAHDVAKAELAVFERETIQLESSYRAMRDLLDGNALTPEGLAVKLGDLELRWWDLTFRIFDNDALADPALLDLRTAMLASARLWRSFLAGYSTGLRKRDHVMIATAFDELARAQEMQSRARLFLR